MNFTHGKIVPIAIHEEVKDSFIDYAECGRQPCPT